MSRILLSMSLGDILSSIGWFLGAWMVPTGFDPNFYGDQARGSAATCRFQGFIFQLGVFASLFFNGSIAAVYLLMVRCAIQLVKTTASQALSSSGNGRLDLE